MGLTKIANQRFGQRGRVRGQRIRKPAITVTWYCGQCWCPSPCVGSSPSHFFREGNKCSFKPNRNRQNQVDAHKRIRCLFPTQQKPPTAPCRHRRLFLFCPFALIPSQVLPTDRFLLPPERLPACRSPEIQARFCRSRNRYPTRSGTYGISRRIP